MSLTDELEHLVKIGKIKEIDIVQAIYEIRKQPEINEFKNEYKTNEMDNIQDNRETERKILKSELSDKAKKVIIYLVDMLNPISNRHKINTLIRERFGWNRKEVMDVMRELKIYSKELGVY